MNEETCAICGSDFDPEESVFDDICDECADEEGEDE